MKTMKHFLKGAAAVAIIIFILMLIHIFFEMKGLDFNNYISNYVEILLATSFGVTIYEALIRKEKNSDDRNEK